MSNSSDNGRWVLAFGISIAYGTCFVVGFLGNCAVIVMILNIFFTVSSVASSQHSTKHVFIYVLGLSVVDLFVIVHLPFLITDLQLKQWIFGQAMCKVYWIGESVNKILSTFILTALSWDRYLATCRPVQSWKFRQGRVACFVLFISTLSAVLLLMPIFLEANVHDCFVENGTHVACYDAGSNVSGLGFDTASKRMKCSTSGVVYELWFLAGIFTAGYVIPGTLMLCFYSLILLHLKTVAQDHSQRVKRVTFRIICVILFYFGCWTPFWINTWLTIFLPPRQKNTWVFSVFYYLVHLLICVNSSINPLLYALINRDLRDQHAIALETRRKSWTAATRTTIEMFQKHGHRLIQVNTSKNAPRLQKLRERYTAAKKDPTQNLKEDTSVPKEEDSNLLCSVDESHDDPE